MKKLILVFLFLSCLGLCTSYADASDWQIRNTDGWKAGAARVKITPGQPMKMAGYTDRTDPSDGTLIDLWAKALALEDSKGSRSVLVTLDLATIKKWFSDKIRDQIQSRYHLSKAQIVLNVSHTHTGPATYSPGGDSTSVYGKRAKEYTEQLGDKIVALVGTALNSLESVQIFSGNGFARFQVNRRNNLESDLTPLTTLNGPNDYSVPVIKVVNKSGKLIAVAFGYACHNTVLKGYEWSGDYAGFAQLDVEKNNPGITALFFQCCGGNMNPLPRRSVGLARQYGQTLASAVQNVLDEKMQELSPNLTTSYEEIPLPLAAPLTIDKLKELDKSELVPYWTKNGIERDIKMLQNGESLPTTYPEYPIQVWRLGNQTMIMMGGEVVIEYDIQLKQIFGNNIFVLGYSNDVMTYIPTAAMLRAGDYEGGIVQLASGLRWSLGMESFLLSHVIKLAKEAGVAVPDYLESSLQHYRYTATDTKRY